MSWFSVASADVDSNVDLLQMLTPKVPNYLFSIPKRLF